MSRAPRHGVLFDPPIALVGRCIGATLEAGKRWNGIEKTMVSGKGWKILGNWWNLWKMMLNNVVMLIRAYFFAKHLLFYRRNKRWNEYRVCIQHKISKYNEWNLILSKRISPMSRAPRHGVLFDPPIALVGRCIGATLEAGKRWNGIEKTMVSGKGWKILENWWNLWKMMLNNVIMLIRAYFLWNTSYSINEIWGAMSTEYVFN